MSAELDPREERALGRQLLLSRLFAPLTSLLFWFFNLYRRHRFVEWRALRRELWQAMDRHPGPVIFVANHLSIVDAALLQLALFGVLERLPWSRRSRRLFFTVVDAQNAGSLQLGKAMYSAESEQPGYLEQIKARGDRSRLTRLVLYLLGLIPIDRREDADPASPTHPQRVLARCSWLLGRGRSICLFPEGRRSRRGWFPRRLDSPFLSQLLLRHPEAAVACFYLRADGQVGITSMPPRGARYRLPNRLLLPEALRATGEPAQAAVEAIADLQEEWFRGSELRRGCTGAAVISLASLPPASARHERLTPRELRALDGLDPAAADAKVAQLLAAKEAARQALRQGGYPDVADAALEVDPFRGRVEWGKCEVEVGFPPDAPDGHCLALAVLRGGSLSEEEGDLVCEWEESPEPRERSPRLLLEVLAEMHDEIEGVEELELLDADGPAPRILWRGAPQDWGACVAHSDRLAVAAFLASSA